MSVNVEDVIIWTVAILGMVGTVVLYIGDIRVERRKRRELMLHTRATRLLDGERFPMARDDFETMEIRVKQVKLKRLTVKRDTIRTLTKEIGSVRGGGGTTGVIQTNEAICSQQTVAPASCQGTCRGECA